jgi:hypothetical protein
LNARGAKERLSMDLSPSERFRRLALAAHPDMSDVVRQAATTAIAHVFATPKVFPNHSSAWTYLQWVLQSGSPEVVDIVAPSFPPRSVDLVDMVDGATNVGWYGDAYDGLGALLVQVFDTTPGHTVQLLLLAATNIAHSPYGIAFVHSVLLTGGPQWTPGDATQQRNHVVRRLAPGAEWGDLPARLALDARLRQITTLDAWANPTLHRQRPRVCAAKTWLVWGTEATTQVLQAVLAPKGVGAHALMAAMALLPDWETTRRLPHAAIERALEPFLARLFGPPDGATPYLSFEGSGS